MLMNMVERGSQRLSKEADVGAEDKYKLQFDYITIFLPQELYILPTLQLHITQI
jgi:hypothetical protein